MTKILPFFLVTLLAQQTQTPSQLLQQAEELIRQARSQLTVPRSTQTQTPVSTAAQLVAALAAGGAITAAPGTYVGNFVIGKNGTTLTGPGVILKPANQIEPTLTIVANDVQVGAIEVQNGAPDRETLVIGSPDATTAAAQPHRVTLTKMAVTSPSGFGHRGYAIHGIDVTLDGATCTGFLERFRDSQCVWINNTPGPVTVVNGTFEGSGENLLVGGADPKIPGVVPSDLVIRNNTFRKPQAWRATKGAVKNILELKNARRVLIEGNTFDGNWADAQPGHPIVFTVRNQEGSCPWCLVDEVTFRNNIVRNTPDGFAVNILGSDDNSPSQQTQRITIDHNLFEDAPLGIQVINGVAAALIVTNNTFPKITGRLLSWSSANRTQTPLTFSRNVARVGEYGITGDGTTGVGLPSLLANATVTEWNGNILEPHPDRALRYPAGSANVLLAPGGLAALLDPKTFKLLSGTAGY